MRQNSSNRVIEMKNLRHILYILLISFLCAINFAFSAILPSSAHAFTAATIGDYGNVTVMEAAGNYDAKNPDGSNNSEPREVIAKEFFRTHKDEYDFLVIFSNFDFKMPEQDARAFYSGIKNNTQGIGLPLFDNSALFGSNGKLQGIIDMGNASSIPVTPLDSKFEEALEILSHELMHRWGAYIKFRDLNGNISSALLGKDGSHWSFLLDSSASVLYGNKWQDNGNGTFTSIVARKYYSPLDLYLMGFVDKSQAPPMQLIDNPDIDPKRLPEIGITIAGTPRYITIDDIIAAEGERLPRPIDAQKRFKTAFILITLPGTFSGDELYKIEMFRNGSVTRFSILTDGKGLMEIASTQKEDIPTNPGIALPPVTPRTLPPNIEDGVRWLISNQQMDGSWMDLPQTAGRDTAESVFALKNFDVAQQNYTQGLQWLNGADTGNTDYLSRRIEAMASAGQDASAQIAELLSRQNADGGWGSNKTYMSSPIDTSFALNALSIAGYSDPSVISKAIEYLKSKQNSDGGWGSDDNGSSIKAAAKALSVFNKYRSKYQLEEQIQRGIEYLMQRQNFDGGFGSSPSTVYDTALSVLTLRELDASIEITNRGLNYILNLQSQNGSWYESPYQTALSVKAVWEATIDPDLSIKSADITFIPNSIKSLPSNIVINANVWNMGRTSVQAKVVLYKGAISEQNRVGEQILAFPGLSQTTATFSTIINEGGDYRFYVAVDPENLVGESSELNNSASNILRPEPTYDFEILPSDASVSQNPADIFQDVKISSRITNKGTMNAYNVQVKYYIDEAGIPFDIATATVDVLAGAAITNEITWRANKAGVNLPITVFVDSFNNYTELSEENNKAVAYLTVNSATEPNITDSYKDIIITSNPANERGSVNISALVKNEGFSTANNIIVNFYKGVPDAGGVLLGTQTIAALNPGQESRVSIDWTNIAESGERIIYVQTDPANQIREIREDDNDAFITLKILSLPDLAISTNSIAFNPSAPKDGDAVSISVTVKNLGEQDASNITVRAYEGNTFIGSQIIPVVAGNSQSTASFIYDTTGKSGTHQVGVSVDSDNTIIELSEDNNSASRAFGVQDANLWLTEQYISPNGDGVKDSAQFFFRLSAAQTVKIVAVNEKGIAVRTFSGPEFENSTGGNITWDGLNDNGMVVDDGQYQMQIVGINNSVLGSLIVTVDNNRSPLTKAIGTKYLLNNNLTCNLPDIWDWERFPDESGIVFNIPWDYLGTPEYPAGLYTMLPDGEDIQRIVPLQWSRINSAYYREYRLSPDGEKIAFVLDDWNSYSGGSMLSQLWIVDRDGGNLTLLDDTSDLGRYWQIHSIVWSPDGNYIAYGRGSDFMLIRPDGTGKIKIDDVGDTIWKEYIRWSYDSSKIAYAYGYGPDRLRVSDISGNKRNIFAASEFRIGYPYFEWLNNGRIVLREELYNWESKLWLIDAGENNDKKELSSNLDDYYEWFAIAPHKRALAFTANVDEAAYLNISDAEGNASLLYEIKVNDSIYCKPYIRYAIWSPDGRKIAFVGGVEQVEAGDIGVIEVCNELSGPSLFVVDVGTKKTASFAVQYPEIRLVRWLADNISIVGGDYNNIYAVDSSTGEIMPLISNVNSDPFISPLERYISYYQSVALSSVCYGRGWSDLWAMSSLLNLTADLRVSKQKSAVVLKGIAADLNFEGYALEYADAKNLNVWNLVAPPSDVPVINDVFTTWVPPYEGTFYVRLTVWDKAGNKAFDRKRISWGLSSSLTNLYKSREIFSPNGDGVKDTVELHYRVLEPVHLEFYIYDENNNLVRTFYKDYTSPVDDFVVWDGRDEANRIVPDGKYKIKIFDYEFFVVVDNTPPDVNLSITPVKQRSDNLFLFVGLEGHVLDSNIKEWVIEYGQGDNPEEWFELRKNNNLIDYIRDNLGRVISESNIQSFNEESLHEFGCEYGKDCLEWLVGKKLRITAEDYAGNRSAAIANYLRERIILHRWADLVSTAIINLNYPELPAILPGIISPQKILPANLDKIGPYFDSSDNLLYLFSIGMSPYLKKLGEHYLGGFETIKAPIAGMNVQYSDEYDYNKKDWIWRDSQPVGNLESRSISLYWDRSNLGLREPYAVRIKAVDINGNEYFSNILESSEIFELNPICPSEAFPPVTMGVLNSTFNKPKLIRFQAISLQDPDYMVWRDVNVELCYKNNNEISRSEWDGCFISMPLTHGMEPEGKFLVHVPADQFKPEMAYEFRMVGVQEGTGLDLYSNITKYPPEECGGIALDISYALRPGYRIDVFQALTVPFPLIQKSFYYDSEELSCGFVSDKAIISISHDEVLKGVIRKGLSLTYYIEKPNGGFDILKSFDLTKETGDSVIIDTNAFAEDKYKVKAVLKYLDVSGKIVELVADTVIIEKNGVIRDESAYLIIDRILPTAQINYPDKSLTMCPIPQGDWFGIPVEGISEDNINVKRYVLYYGIGENPSYWMPAMTRKFNPVTNAIEKTQITGDSPVRGQLGIWDVTDLKGTIFSLKLKVIDVVGNVSCYTTSFSVDTVTEITSLGRDKYLFSPNGDGVLDDVNISYEINEYASVDVRVFRLLQGADGHYTLDSAPVRTIVSGLQHLSGTENTSWDGRGDSGAPVPDGKYGVAVFATDSCNNTTIKWIAVEVDNTPPTTVITYPRPGDPLGNIVEVKGTADDLHFQSYTLEYGQGDNPDAWLFVSSGANPVKDNILGKWNTFGLDGRWTLRLTAQDSVGNKNTTLAAIDLGVRKTLIKDLSAAPKLFSPNNDGRLDTAIINYELTDACQVNIDILDANGAVKKAYTTTAPSLGTYTYTWDGKDNAGAVVSDGPYTVRLTAALLSNTSVTQAEAVTVSVDTTLPNIDIKQPVNDSYIRTDIAVNGIINDTNIIEYYVTNTGSAGPALLDQGNQSRENYTFGILNELAEDRYSLNIRARDLGENILERNIVFTIDKTAPKVVLDAPKDGEYHGSDKNIINITGSIIEKNLETFSLRYGLGESPAQWTNLLTGNAVPTNLQLFAWKVGKNDGIPDGLYTISLYAKDKAGAEAEVKVKVAIDNTLPEASITLPIEGGYVKGAIDVKGTAFDQNLDKYNVEISEGQCANAFKWLSIKASSASVRDAALVSWQTIPPDGEYCLRLTAIDKVGSKTEARVNVKIDTQPPEAPVLSGRIENKSNISLSWAQNAEPDLAGYNLYRDSQRINTTLISNTTYLDQNLREGIYTYIVKAIDLAGNESKPSNEIKLKIDLTGPDARIRSPQDGSKVSGLLDIKGTAYSSDDFKQYRLYIGQSANPSIWNLIRTSPVPMPYGALTQWDTIALSEGLYSIKLEAEDISGNINAHQIVVAIDNTPPAAPVLISAIANGSDVAATWQTNIEPDLAGYLLYRNDQLVNVSGIVVGELKPYLIAGTAYPDGALPDGTFKYYLIAMDQAGNISEQSNVIEVVIDTRAPKADIVEPLDKSRFERKTFIKAESADLDIASVQFQYKRLQDTAWINLDSPAAAQPYAAYIDPVVLGLTYGDYNLRAAATDRGGKTDPAPSFITVTYTDLTAPNAPIELKALTNGRDVSLTWTANAETDLDGYNVYRISGAARTKVNASIIKNTAYQDIGLSDGSYTYEATAVDIYNNESKPSNPASAKVYAPIIAQPYTPTGQKNITINGSEAAADSAVDVSVEAVGSMLLVASPSDSDGNFTGNVGLSLGENRITAKATDSAGNISRASDTVVVVYNEPPSAPAGLAASVQDYNVSLAWNSNTEPDLSGYNLYRKGEKVNATSPITSGTIMASSSGYYNPPIRAYDGDLSTYWMSSYSYGAFNPEWWEMTIPSPELINRIEIYWGSEIDYQDNEVLYAGKDYEIQVWSGYAWITQAKITGNNAKINTFDFKPSYRTDKIRIYITDATDANYSKTVRISEVKISKDNLITQALYNDANLRDGVYGYNVTAVDYYGFESLPSEIVTTAVGDVVPPAAPVNLTAAAIGSDIILNWFSNAEPDLAGYNIYRNSAQGWLKINTALISGAAYTDIGLINGSYTYRVAAVDNTGNESLPSNEASAIVNIALPQPPLNLRITAMPEGSSLNALWEYTGNASGYNIYRAETSGGPYTKINAAFITGTSYLDKGLANRVIYYYVVAALDSLGNESAYSNEASGISSDTIPPAKPEIFFPTLHGNPVAVYKDKTDISGFAEPGSIFELFKDGASMGKAAALGNNLVQDIMVNYNGSGISISPDGKSLLYVYNDSIWLKDIAAGSAARIIQSSESPLWSPDGGRFAYTFQDNNWNNRIGIYDIETGRSSALSDDANVYEDSPSWSDDGKKIAFISSRGGSQDVWIKDLASGSFTQATNSGNVTGLKLSPDARMAAYFEYQNLYLIDILSGNITAIDTQTDGYSLSWSSDSRRLAFVSNRNGNADIYALDAITKSQIQITNSVNEEINPVWSPDNRSIVFAIWEGSRASVWLASSNAQGHEQMLKQNLYNLNYLSWAKSGGIAYIDQNRLNIVYLKGYFNLKDMQLTSGENIFYAIASDSSGNAGEPSDRINVIFDTNLMPDLEITKGDIFVYPPYPTSGKDVAIYISAWNRGKVEVKDVKADIYLLDSSGNLELLKSEDIPYIAPDSAGIIELNWNSGDKLGANSIIAFIDPDDRIYELREINNIAVKDIFVMASEGILMETKTDSERYQANQDVNINVSIKNSGRGEDVTLIVQIEDGDGNLAASLNPINASLAYASGEDFNLIWNTGYIFAGAYQAHSILKNGSNIIAENMVPFTVLPGINIDSSITTDRTNYGPRENVVLSVNIKNNGRNYIIPELAVNLRITDLNNNTLFTEGKTLKNIMPDAANALNSVWNTGLALPGSYNASVEIYNNNQLVSAKTASFIIDNTLIITGNITAEPSVVIHGRPVQVDYTVRNSGNMNVNGLPLRLIVINPEDQSIMNSLENAVDIPINSSQTGRFIFSTQGYKLKTYVVVLQYVYQDKIRSVASASFTVRDGAPPSINLISPESGRTYSARFDIAAAVTDDASGVERVEYQIDNGAWRLLPLSDQAAGRYSTSWAPVVADEGVHTISFRAIDKTGNMSEPVSSVFVIKTLAGTLTVQPNLVYQGSDISINYTITNTASEDIANLNVKVVIVDADTQEIKQIFEIMPNVPMNTTITGSLILSTINLAPKRYLARLEAATAAMAEYKTLASAAFEVKPSIGAAKTIPDVTNLLVWVNEKCAENSNEDYRKCIRIDLLEVMLKEAAASYFIVYDKKDFETQLRNPYFTDIFILGNHYPLEDHYIDELRELVYSGKGLISSLYLNKGDDHEADEHDGEDQKDEFNTLFGIRYKGYLSGYEHMVNILDSPISSVGTLKAIGEAIKVEANNPDAVAAWIEDEEHNKELKEYPGIILNNYGNGKAIFYAFDLGKTLNDENYSQMSIIIKNSIAYIHRPMAASVVYPYQLVPVETKLRSLGSAFDLRITEAYSEGMKLYDPTTGKWITDNPWIVDIHLEPNEGKTMLYYALAPDKIGAYKLKTEIGYIMNGDYNFYQNINTDISVEKDTAAITSDIISALNLLSAPVKEKEEINNAIKYIEKTQNRTIVTKDDIEKNIHDLLKAVDSLLYVTSADISAIRLMIDKLLMTWESRYYLEL